MPIHCHRGEKLRAAPDRVFSLVDHLPCTAKWLPTRVGFIALSILITALVALSCGAAETPESRALEGTWNPVKAELGGQPMPESILKTISLKLSGGVYEVTVGRATDKGTYTIDASTTPKTMTVNGTDGPNKGRTFPAIFELDGDTLRICYDLSGTKRPDEFKTLAGTRLYLVSYRRQSHP